MSSKRTQGMEIGRIGLPRVVVNEHPSSVNDYSIRVFLTFNKALEETEIGRQVLHKLQASDNAAALDGTMIKRGNYATGFDVKRLAAWWLWRANEVGQKQADCDLEAFFNSDRIDVLGVLWVYGVATETTQKLTEDISLIPVEEMPDSNDKEYILKSNFRPQFALGVELLPRAALVRRYKSTKLLRNDRPEIKSGEMASRDFKAQNQLHEAGLLLNCLPGVCCTAGYFTSYCPPEVPLGPFGGSGGGQSIRDIIQLGASRLEPGHEAILSKLMRKFQGLPASTKPHFERALLRLAQAKGRIDIQDRALDLGIALEMLLLNDVPPEQLSLHFRLRGAWLIGKTPAERQDLFRLFNRIYRWRSKVAHNGYSEELSGSKSLTHTQVNEKMAECFAVAERVFQTLITRGTPEWNKLILGLNANQIC